jgi:hypothetical protein
MSEPEVDRDEPELSSSDVDEPEVEDNPRGGEEPAPPPVENPLQKRSRLRVVGAEEPAPALSTPTPPVTDRKKCPYIAKTGQYANKQCKNNALEKHGGWCSSHKNTIFAQKARGEYQAPPAAEPKPPKESKRGKKPSFQEFVQSEGDGEMTYDLDEVMQYLHINDQIKRAQAQRSAPIEEEEEEEEEEAPKPVKKVAAKPKAEAAKKSTKKVEESKKAEPPVKKAEEPKKVEAPPQGGRWQSFGIA